MPKPLLWIIAVAVAMILIFVWNAESKPVRVTIINQGAATLHEVVVGGVQVGKLRGGESRVLTVPPAETLKVTFTLRGEAHVWAYHESFRAGTSLVLEVTPQGRVRRATPSISSSSSRRQMSAWT